VSVAAEIIEHLLRAAERRLGIDHPLPTAQTIDQMLESSWLSKMSESATKGELAALVRPPELFTEEAAKETRENSHGEKEVLTTTDPALTVEGETAAGDHAMQVWVMEQILAPGMEHGQKADLGAEVFGIKGNSGERLRSGRKENVVDGALVLQGEMGQLLRECKDNMEVLNWQQVRQTVFEPTRLSERLTLGTVPIAARVVRDAPQATRVTLIDMTAEHASAALFDSAHDATLLWRQRVRGAKGCSVLAEDVGHLERWSRHQRRAVVSAGARSSSGLGVACTVSADT